MNLATSIGIAVCLTVISTSTRADSSATGTIATYRLDMRQQDSSVCIQLEPPLSGEKWACLTERNTVAMSTPTGPAYIQPCTHLRELIHDGYLSKKVCTIWWQFVDAFGNALISAVECKQ
jgi:hypothetical protein